MQFLLNVVSFNRNYLSASLVYLGMTFVMLSAVPEIVLHAQSGGGSSTSCSHTVTHYDETGPVTETVPGCPAGYTCCEMTGECVEIE